MFKIAHQDWHFLLNCFMLGELTCRHLGSVVQATERIANVTSDENLADSVHSQHFAGKKNLAGICDACTAIFDQAIKQIS